MATQELIFPRVVYRGLPDTLGRGTHAHPDTGETVGETKEVGTQDAYDQALKDGWRATREDPDADADDEADSAAAGASGTDERGDAPRAPRTTTRKRQK